MSHVKNMGREFNRFLDDERGATMVEYAIMIAMVAAVCMVIIGTLGQQVNEAFIPVSEGLP